MMRLKKKQKEALFGWIAEGLETDEINARAAVFDPPFEVTTANVSQHRKRRAIDLEAIQQAGEYDALTEGLARKEERVQKLQQLAALMERDLLGGFLWVEDVKSVGSGPYQKIVDFEKFNQAEVDAYRGVLDDIAKEVGHRRQSVDLRVITPEQAAQMSDDEIEDEMRKRGLL